MLSTLKRLRSVDHTHVIPSKKSRNCIPLGISQQSHCCPCTRRVSTSCHPSKVSNFKCKLVGKRNIGHRHWTKARSASKSGTNGSIWWGNYGSFFEPISQRGRRGFPLGLELKHLQQIWISAKKTTFLFRLVQDPAMKGVTYSDYAIKPKNSKRQTDTKTQGNTL